MYTVCEERRKGILTRHKAMLLYKRIGFQNSGALKMVEEVSVSAITTKVTFNSRCMCLEFPFGHVPSDILFTPIFCIRHFSKDFNRERGHDLAFLSNMNVPFMMRCTSQHNSEMCRNSFLKMIPMKQSFTEAILT